jgi:hypothetical protein
MFVAARRLHPNSTSPRNVRLKFPIGHRRYVQFRTEVFNAFNHPNFNPPNLARESSAFGRPQREDHPIWCEILFPTVHEPKTARSTRHCTRSVSRPSD